MRLSADVVVAGGGTAGCAAAVAAARRGRRVILFEEGNALGGVSTAGGVSEFYAGLEGLGEIFARLRAELSSFGALEGRYYNPEYLKAVWQLLAEEAGVRIVFHASVCGAAASAGRVTGVQVNACSRQMEAEAAFFVDATGEGDLAALAGAEFALGHPDSGRTLHLTLVFTLRDTGRPVRPHLPPGLAPIASDRELPGLGHVPLPDGRVYCNITKVMGHDPTDPLSLSAAEVEARRQLIRVVHYLQRAYYPTFTLASSGARIGIREGRRVKGDYVLRGEEIRAPGGPKDFPDGVAVATAQIDFHSLTRPGRIGWRERVEPYAIPFRCLTAKGFRNLLLAGKCISGDQVAMSSYRMTPTCCAMGQAAGTAAAMAVERGLDDLRQLDVAELREELRRAGMELDPRRHRAFAPESTPDPADAD